MIEAARCDINIMLQSVPWLVGHSLSDLYFSVMWKSKLANQMQPEALKSLPENLCRPITVKLPTVGEVYLKCSAKLLEAS